MPECRIRRERNPTCDGQTVQLANLSSKSPDLSGLFYGLQKLVFTSSPQLLRRPRAGGDLAIAALKFDLRRSRTEVRSHLRG